jgi:hypothetical protein
MTKFENAVSPDYNKYVSELKDKRQNKYQIIDKK